ncbi:threonylcarbamoyl-AMP synthase [Candidatus Woesearchaeota archaeon]|nr:threonylcarbamoyl-AMP synthase [Candidatus Woesearchaeota archaeon]
MEVLNKDEFLGRKHVMVQKLRSSVFVYPTDTIYGIGCNAEDEELVDNIRMLKKRFDMSFSIIAPSKDWIRENCVVNKKAEEWLDKLPGPYTLIMKLKNKDVIAENVNLEKDTVGVRMPDNWFSEIVSQMGVPVVTTSANVSGKDFMTSVDNLDPEIKKGVNYVIDDGAIKGSPSTLVFLDKKSISLKER